FCDAACPTTPRGPIHVHAPKTSSGKRKPSPAAGRDFRRSKSQACSREADTCDHQYSAGQQGTCAGQAATDGGKERFLQTNKVGGRASSSTCPSEHRLGTQRSSPHQHRRRSSTRPESG